MFLPCVTIALSVTDHSICTEYLYYRAVVECKSCDLLVFPLLLNLWGLMHWIIGRKQAHKNAAFVIVLI